jgi:tRNA(Ile)-lysidine synthetase-like protein
MDCGKECHIPGIRAVREDGRIRMDKRTVKLQKSQAEYLLEIPGQFEIENFLVTTCLLENDPQLQKEIIEEKKYTKWFSYDTITNDVCFRKRRTGDYLVINDAGGRKKLKDYLIDCKIPRDKRDDLWLLASGSHVLWIVGYRISSDAKVNQNTKKVCKIQLEEVLE